VTACAILGISTLIRPLTEPRALPDAGVVDMQPYSWSKPAGGLIIALTLGLYAFFW